MNNIFISYARSDGYLAERLVRLFKDLREFKVSGWLDAADLTTGDAFPGALREALQKSNAVVVLLSPDSLQSEWVQFEIGAAEALGKKIIPLIVSGEKLEQQLPDILKDRMWIDARGQSDAIVAKKLEHALESLQ